MCLLAPAAAITSLDDGDPITLSDSAETAPEVTPGLHTMNMPDSLSPAYFSVPRTMKKSTIWAGETLITERPIETSMFVTPTVAGSSGDCGPGTYFETYYNFHDFFTGAARSTAKCQGSDKVVFMHTGWDSPKFGGDQAQLVVWEEPFVDASILPPPALSLPWVDDEPPAKGSVDLGGTYADAPELVGGRWSVHIDPGRTALFKVPLDWNQHLQLGLTNDGPASADNVLVKPILVNPVGATSKWGTAVSEGDVEAPDYQDLDLKYSSLDGGVVSPSITWRNREATDVTAAFPGTYYVMLRLAKKEIQKQGADITISTQVITDKAAASPYDEKAAPVPALDGSDQDAGSDPEKKASTGPSTENPTPWAAVSGLFGGSAVLAVAGVLALGRHRRSRA